MQYTRLGRTGCKVSRLCLSPQHLGQEVGEKESHNLMDRAMDLASLEGLEGAARAAGVRGLVRSGLARVEAGEVSVEELARVLRFDE